MIFGLSSEIVGYHRRLLFYAASSNSSVILRRCPTEKAWQVFLALLKFRESSEYTLCKLSNALALEQSDFTHFCSHNKTPICQAGDHLYAKRIEINWSSRINRWIFNHYSRSIFLMFWDRFPLNFNSLSPDENFVLRGSLSHEKLIK